METAVRSRTSRIALIDAYYTRIRMHPNDPGSMIDGAGLLSIVADITASSPRSDPEKSLQYAAGLYRQAERLLGQAIALADSQNVIYQVELEERRIRALHSSVETAIAIPSERRKLRITNHDIVESSEAAEIAETMIGELLHDIDLKDAALNSARVHDAGVAHAAYRGKRASGAKSAATYGAVAFMAVFAVGSLYMAVESRLEDMMQVQEGQDYMMRNEAHYIRVDNHLWTVKGLSGNIEAEFRIVIQNNHCVPEVYKQNVSFSVLNEAEHDACYAVTLKQIQ